MATAYVPVLTDKNYDSFRKIIKDAPSTFAEWQHHIAVKAIDLSSKGFKVESVEVDPDEFKKDCEMTESPYNLHSLDNFAFKVAQRNGGQM
jgi:hypothetical protein